MPSANAPHVSLRVAPHIAAALAERRPVVALESSVFAQGLPIPANRDAAARMLGAVERRGAISALSAVVDGVPAFGLDHDEFERFLARDGIVKVSARDLPWAMLRRCDGATTVAATLALAGHAGIRVFATGGIGGVHREPAYDESADLVELARTSVVVVCSGAKSILDLGATLERLESLSVPVVGYGTDEFPGFFTARTGLRLASRVESPAEVAQFYRLHRAIGRPGAVLVVQPPPAEQALDEGFVEGAVSRALAEARARQIRGSEVTPFLLATVERETGGRSLAANLALLEANAALAAEIAAAVSAEMGE